MTVFRSLRGGMQLDGHRPSCVKILFTFGQILALNESLDIQIHNKAFLPLRVVYPIILIVRKHLLRFSVGVNATPGRGIHLVEKFKLIFFFHFFLFRYQ